VADHLREALGRMLDEYDARRASELARERKLKDDDAQFLARFAELRRDVVRPVFEAAGAMLAERGHAFTISEQEFAVGGASEVSEAGISLHIVPAGMGAQMHDDHARTLSITTRHYNKTVWINAGRSLDPGGMAGAKGAYPIERIDRQLVEEQLIKFVAGIVAG
jgi:hypothetical protein